MISVRQLQLRATVARRSEASAHLKRVGDAVLVARGALRLLVLICPCGCGEELPVNLDERAGPAWQLYEDARQGGVSLFPSVWRDSGCRSHFIIWRDKVLLFGKANDEVAVALPSDATVSLRETVFDHLPVQGLRSFVEIAAITDVVPWDVLAVCRELVRARRAREGRGLQRGMFGRSES